MALAEEISLEWRSRLQAECPDQPSEVQEAISRWLVGESTDRFSGLDSAQLAVVKQAMDYRFRILQQRYLGVPPERAYKALIQRLSGLSLIRSKIRTWVSLSRDRRRTVIDVLQEVIQELMQSDTYIRQQMLWISSCTKDLRLRNSLMLATVEEYCLRPIRNQPLLSYRFVNYLRRMQRGGMTQVPTGDLVRLVSEEITTDEADNPISLMDSQAITSYQEEQELEEQLLLRTSVKREFYSYLEEKVGPVAVEWLELHLQGKTQDAIAQELNLPIKQMYRLREKISYHAIRVFGLKHEAAPLVSTWLGISLQDHSLGLTPERWQQLLGKLTPEQSEIVQQLKVGNTVESIAKERGVTTNQVMGDWLRIYLIAQELRNED